MNTISGLVVSALCLAFAPSIAVADVKAAPRALVYTVHRADPVSLARLATRTKQLREDRYGAQHPSSSAVEMSSAEMNAIGRGQQKRSCRDASRLAFYSQS